MHAGCGWVTMEIEGLDSVEALAAVKAGSALALSIASISVGSSSEVVPCSLWENRATSPLP